MASLPGYVSDTELYYETLGSEHNLLTGRDHTVTGSDNLVSGADGTVVGSLDVLHSLDGAAHTLTGSNTFAVYANSIILNGTTIGSAGISIDDLTDVAVAAPATGDILVYSAASPAGWVNQQPTLETMTDVALTSPPSDGDLLTYSATSPAGWVNAQPVVKVDEVPLSSGDVLALRATPITLVAAPGVGQVLEFIGGILLLDATATAYVETNANLAVKYTNGSGVQVSETIEATGFIDQTADTMTTMRPKLDAIVAKAGCENQALVLHNLGAGEYTTGTGTLRVKVAYRTWSTGW